MIYNVSIFRCLSTLYQDPNWSQKDLRDAINRAQRAVSSSKGGAFSPERLKYYFQELSAMESSGRKVSFTDLWGLIVEYFLQQKVIELVWMCTTVCLLLGTFADLYVECQEIRCSPALQADLEQAELQNKHREFLLLSASVFPALFLVKNFVALYINATEKWSVCLE